MAKINHQQKNLVESGEIRVIHQKISTLPLVAITLFIPAGSIMEPAEQQGVAGLTADILTGQTAVRDIYSFNRYIERYGLRVASSIHSDFVNFSFSAPSQQRQRLIEIIREIFQSPGIEAGIFSKYKKIHLSRCKSRKDRASTLVYDKLLEKFYPGHPYNHSPAGTPKTLNNMELKDLTAFYQENYSNQGVVGSVVGDIELEEAVTIFEKLSLPSVKVQKPPAPSQFGQGKVTLEGAVDQPTHTVVYPSPAISEPDNLVLKLFNCYLGQGMSSLLFAELREKRGLGYHVGSSYPNRQFTAPFSLRLGGGDSSGEEFLTVLQQLFSQLAKQPLPHAVLRDVKNKLTGNFLLSHERFANIAWYSGFYEFMGLGVEYDANFPELISKVEPSEIQQVVEKTFLSTKPLFITLLPEGKKTD